MPANQTLLGREGPIGLLTGLLERASAHGAALLIHGEPGVGKSALLHEAEKRATRAGMRVLRTIGHQSEAQMPFAGVHQLLCPIMTQIDELPGPQRDALLGAFGSARAAPDLFLVALATLSLLSDCAAASSSLLLIADDAHWLDSPSRQVVSFIARRLESDPIVLLIAVREGYDADIERCGIPDLLLAGLDRDAAEALLDREAPDLPSAIRRRVKTEAAGNPLALVELPHAWRRRGDESSRRDGVLLTKRLEQSFAARVGELPAATRTMLLVAALNDNDSLTELLHATAILSDARPSMADLAPAEAAQLIDVHERGLRFRHPLIRSVIQEMAGVDQRYDTHAALARTLAGQADRAVWHAAAAAVGPDEEVASQLEASAFEAQRRGAASVAIDALRRSIQLSEEREQRGKRLLAAAELASALARHDELADILAQLEHLELPERQRHKVAWFREFIADASGDGTVRSMVDCARQLIDDGEEQSALNALVNAALKCHWLRSDEATRESVVAVANQLSLEPDDARLLPIYALATPAKRAELVIQLASRTSPADLLRQIPDESKAFEAVRLQGIALQVTDNERSREFREASIRGLRQQGRLTPLSLELGSQSVMALALADWRLAARAGEEAIRLAGETRQPRHEAAAQLALAAVAATRGDFSGAEAMIGKAERIVANFRPRWPFPVIEVVRGTSALASGAYLEAFDRCSRIFDPADESHHWQTSHWALTLMDLADSAVHSRNVQAARAIVESLSGPVNSLEFRWGASYADAVLAEGDADTLFHRAFSSAPASEHAHARLHLAYGTRLRRQRRIAESRPHLRAALEAFDAAGTKPWYERANQELRASGETIRRRAPETRDDLSPQELQIALLAAEGLTNREIGARLFVSHRTVGSHLYRIFPKLSITSRAELRGAVSQFASGSRRQSGGKGPERNSRDST